MAVHGCEVWSEKKTYLSNGLGCFFSTDAPLESVGAKGTGSGAICDFCSEVEGFTKQVGERSWTTHVGELGKPIVEATRGRERGSGAEPDNSDGRFGLRRILKFQCLFKIKQTRRRRSP